MLALTASSISFTLTLIPFAAGGWCFSKSSRDDLDTFIAFSFCAVLIGFMLSVLIGAWLNLNQNFEKGMIHEGASASF